MNDEGILRRNMFALIMISSTILRPSAAAILEREAWTVVTIGGGRDATELSVIFQHAFSNQAERLWMYCAVT